MEEYIRQYYFLDAQIQKGPFSFDEFKTMNIRKDTLVWFEGLETWVKAGDIEQLQDLNFYSTPPPPPPPLKSSEQVSDNHSINVHLDIVKPTKGNRNISKIVSKELIFIFKTIASSLMAAIVIYYIVAFFNLPRTTFDKKIIAVYHEIGNISETDQINTIIKIKRLYNELPELKNRKELFNYLFRVQDSNWQMEFGETERIVTFPFKNEYLRYFYNDCFLPKKFGYEINILRKNNVSNNELASFSPLFDDNLYNLYMSLHWDVPRDNKFLRVWEDRLEHANQQLKEDSYKSGLYAFIILSLIILIVRYLYFFWKWISRNAN